METGREGRGCHTPMGEPLDQAKAQCLAAEGKEGRTKEISDWGLLPACLPPAQSPFLSLYGRFSMEEPIRNGPHLGQKLSQCCGEIAGVSPPPKYRTGL